jgi:uncharacterized membrane protein
MNHTKDIILKYESQRKAKKRAKVMKIIKVIFWVALFIAFYAICSNGTYPY